MDWRLKAGLQNLFSVLPGGHQLNNLFRRHITHGLPVTDAVLMEHCGYASAYVGCLARYSQTALDAAHFFEFGAGSDLIVPLALFGLGVNRQTLVDITPLAAHDLVADIAERLSRDRVPLGLRRDPPPPDGPDLQDELARRYGIIYQAPGDARHTDLPARSVHLVTSTNTMEHIPPDDILAILTECQRVVSDDGVIACRIDYQDHYSYFDSRISAYNFLRYSDRTWRKYSPNLQFQNRLRHSDYLQLFKRAGWVIVEENPERGSAADLEVVGAISLDERFSRYSPEDLATRSALIVARPGRGV